VKGVGVVMRPIPMKNDHANSLKLQLSHRSALGAITPSQVEPGNTQMAICVP
jgi:hypothetical protein